MKRSLFTAVLSGALVLCSVSVSADTTEGGSAGAPRWGQGGQRGGRGGFGGGQRWGGGRGQFGGQRGGQSSFQSHGSQSFLFVLPIMLPKLTKSGNVQSLADQGTASSAGNI